MKDYSTPAEGILKREADGTIASQEVTEVELVDLAAVATSGDYNDLSNKPTIPDVSNLQPKITANGFLKGNGSGGIITADKPAFYVSIEEGQDGTLTVNKTPEEIYTAYTSGYAVYAVYKNQTLELLLSLRLALPHITEFSEIYGVTESTVGFITVSNTGNGWTKQLTSVPINNKVVPTTRTVNGKALSDDIALTAADVGAQPTIIANGFLKGDGSGNVTIDKPVFTVTITQTEKDGTGTADKTVAEILAAYNAGYNVQAVCTYYNNSMPYILYLLSPTTYDAEGVLAFSGLFYDGSDGDYCQALSVFMLGEVCQCYKTEVATRDVYQRIFEIKQPYLVTFTKKTATEYTADKTLREIFEAVTQRKYFVYGYIDVDYTDAYIPMSSLFTTGQGTTDNPTNYYIYFEGPIASSNSGNMVKNNQCAQFISLAATSNADATSKTYTYTTYQLLSTSATVNNKSFATRSITLNADDVNAVGLKGNQEIAGTKTFTEKVKFHPSSVSFDNGEVNFNGANIFLDGNRVQFLPTVSTSDNGKFLRVVDGAWAAATVDNANGVSF